MSESLRGRIGKMLQRRSGVSKVEMPPVEIVLGGRDYRAFSTVDELIRRVAEVHGESGYGSYMDIEQTVNEVAPAGVAEWIKSPRGKAILKQYSEAMKSGSKVLISENKDP